MAIVYDPTEELEKALPKAKLDKMLKGNLTLKRASLKLTSGFSFINKRSLTDVALKTLKGYKERISADESGETKEEILDDPKQLIQRVSNEVIYQIKEEIKTSYGGERYEWLPSDAEEPDPEHQLNYGKIFVVGDGEMPGDRPGCRCGMRILVDQTELDLG